MSIAGAYSDLDGDDPSTVGGFTPETYSSCAVAIGDNLKLRCRDPLSRC